MGKPESRRSHGAPRVTALSNSAIATGNAMDIQDDPLQAALATAFADSPIPHRRSASLTSSSVPTSSIGAPRGSLPASEETLEGGDESWKEEYDQLQSSWRAESAAARQRAEQERERWRLIREREADEERVREDQQHGHPRDESKDAEWQTVDRARKHQETRSSKTGETSRRLSAARDAAAGVHDAPPRHGSPSPTDARDLVAGETPRGHGIDSLESLLPRPDPLSSEYSASRPSHTEASVSATTPPSNADDQALSVSRTWEEVPSLDSSFPSLSFPGRSGAASPEPRERPPYQQPPAPPSVTLAIFDSSLSTRTRVLALISSLAINMFLPFINGVMLGFGEIFAKNVVSFFGWKVSGAAVGIGAAPRRRRDFD